MINQEHAGSTSHGHLMDTPMLARMTGSLAPRRGSLWVRILWQAACISDSSEDSGAKSREEF